MTWKKFMTAAVIGLLIGVIVAPAQGAMTNSVDARPTAYWWSGNAAKDIGWLFLKEVEDFKWAGVAGRDE